MATVLSQSLNGVRDGSPKGWPRSGLKATTVPAIFGQMVMHQVSGAVVGHLGNVKNTYSRLVLGSSLPAEICQQMHSLDRRELWFSKRPAAVHHAGPYRQGVSKKVAVDISEEVMHLARTLIRRALALHRWARFHRFQFQLDQRAAWVQAARTAQHQDWLMIGMVEGSPRMALPIQAHPAVRHRNAQAIYHGNLASTGSRTAAQDSGKALLQSIARIEQLEATAGRDRNPSLSRFAVPNTVRLILDADGQALSIGVLTDVASTFVHQAAAHRPRKPGKGLCLDLGFATLLAADDDELHGRGWMRTVEIFDRRMTGIARHRQRLGLKLSASTRYRSTVQQLSGWLNAEICRILNKLVTR